MVLFEAANMSNVVLVGEAALCECAERNSGATPRLPGGVHFC